MDNPSQMKRDHTPSPDKGRAGEGLAALESHQVLMQINRRKPPSIPPCQGEENHACRIAQPQKPAMACLLEVDITMASSTYLACNIQARVSSRGGESQALMS
jgi:hypothetical protein